MLEAIEKLEKELETATKEFDQAKNDLGEVSKMFENVKRVCMQKEVKVVGLTDSIAILKEGEE